LKLRHEKLLSNFAFNCNVRHYSVAECHASHAACKECQIHLLPHSDFVAMQAAEEAAAAAAAAVARAEARAGDGGETEEQEEQET
jgi:hypothetical protein